MTDTVGDGGVITGGSQTETDTDSEGSTLSSTETIGETDGFDDETDDEEGDDTDDGEDTGNDTVTETDTNPSQGTDTLAEVLGAEGTIASGLESDSLSEASGATTTETDYPTETVTDSVSDVTMTLTETNTDTDTDNESDQDWAVETLGASATISGGSDCFTVYDLDTSSYVSSGSGPENYNDTADAPNGTATVTGSGSSSSLTNQTFGDILGSGGGIASGSLSYTVTSSETDAATTIESGTETIADELSDGPSQTASYDVSTTMPDNATAYETGTETLGEGGTISGGTRLVHLVRRQLAESQPGRLRHRVDPQHHRRQYRHLRVRRIGDRVDHHRRRRCPRERQLRLEPDGDGRLSGRPGR